MRRTECVPVPDNADEHAQQQGRTGPAAGSTASLTMAQRGAYNQAD